MKNIMDESVVKEVGRHLLVFPTQDHGIDFFSGVDRDTLDTFAIMRTGAFILFANNREGCAEMLAQFESLKAESQNGDDYDDMIVTLQNVIRDSDPKQSSLVS